MAIIGVGSTSMVVVLGVRFNDVEIKIWILATSLVKGNKTVEICVRL